MPDSEEPNTAPAASDWREIQVPIGLTIPSQEGPLAEEEYAGYVRRYDALVAARLEAERTAGWEADQAVDLETVVAEGRAVVERGLFIHRLAAVSIRLRSRSD